MAKFFTVAEANAPLPQLKALLQKLTARRSVALRAGQPLEHESSEDS